MFLQISQNSQWNTCARVSFLKETPFLTERLRWLLLFINNSIYLQSTIRISILTKLYIYSLYLYEKRYSGTSVFMLIFRNIFYNTFWITLSGDATFLTCRCMLVTLPNRTGKSKNGFTSLIITFSTIYSMLLRSFLKHCKRVAQISDDASLR